MPVESVSERLRPEKRWAKVVMRAVLQELMRRKSILTTMRYYATGDKLALAHSIWETSKKAD